MNREEKFTKVEIIEEGDLVIMRLQEERILEEQQIELTGQQLLRAVTSHPKSYWFIVDYTRVLLQSSGMLGWLEKLHKVVKGRNDGSDWAICGLRANVKEGFGLFPDITNNFTFYITLDTARKEMGVSDKR
jgi:hypothetical protein